MNGCTIYEKLSSQPHISYFIYTTVNSQYSDLISGSIKSIMVFKKIQLLKSIFDPAPSKSFSKISLSVLVH